MVTVVRGELFLYWISSFIGSVILCVNSDEVWSKWQQEMNRCRVTNVRVLQFRSTAPGIYS